MIDPVIAQLVERRTVVEWKLDILRSVSINCKRCTGKDKKKKKEKNYFKSARFSFDQTKMFPFFSSYRFTTRRFLLKCLY
jgi:hypothetical protein